MQLHELHLPRLLALILLAMGLGIVVLQLDADRRGNAAANAATLAVGAAASPAPAIAAPQAQSPAGVLVADPEPSGSAGATSAQERVAGVPCSAPHRLVQLPGNLRVRATPGGREVGVLPAASVYMGQPMTAWVQALSSDGRWGRVSVPWTKPVTRSGWIALGGLAGRTTSTMVVADLSDRTLRAFDGCDELFRMSIAVGRPGSPSPTGRFWVTDRVRVPGAQRSSFGSYAFGLSTVQPNLPPGWTGGNQMAIHGTGAAGSIGQAASAGCLRVSEQSLARLRPLLRAGTPVVIRA